MRINTIGIYIFVYLLAHGKWNVLVSVKAESASAHVAATHMAPPPSSTPPVLRLFKSETSGNPVEMVENTDFEMKKEVDGSSTHTFKANVKCTLVTIGQMELWKKGELGVEPKSVTSNDALDEVILRDSGKSVYYRKDTTNQWKYHTLLRKEIPGKTGHPAPPPTGSTTSVVSTPEIKLFKTDTSGKPVEMVEGTDFDRKMVRGEPEYKFKSGVNCAALTYGPVLLWKHDPNQRGGRYPISLYNDTHKGTLVLKFEGLDMTFYKNAYGRWVFTKSGPLAVKFHVVDPNDANNTVELSSTQFTITETGDTTTFTIGDSVNPISLIYGPFLLWQHDPNQHGGKHPKSLDFTKTTEKLVLKFEGLDVKFEKKADGTWEYSETGTSGGGTAGTPASFEGMSSGEDSESSVKQPLNLKDPRFLEIDIKNVRKSEFYTIKTISFFLSKDIVFSPKDEYRFKSVKYRSDVIWKADKVSDCATKVRAMNARVIGYINLVIFTPCGSKKFTKISGFFTSGIWEEITLSIAHN